MTQDPTAATKRKTWQRTLIAEIISQARGPLSIPEIQTASTQLGRTIGIATVYRAIRQMLDEQLLTEVNSPDKTLRYESCSHKHHHHFFCQHCQRLYDIDSPCLIELQATSLPIGFKVTGHEITLTGSCASCSRATKKS